MADPFIAEIVMFGGNFAPRGWALCDGQLLPINQNQALYSLLGTTYGGDGRTTFGLPDLRGRSPVHAGNGPGLNSVRLGQRAGSADAILPVHTHVAQSIANAVAPAGNSNDAVNNYWADDAGVASGTYSTGPATSTMNPGAVTTTIGNAGTSPNNQNYHPYTAVNFIIALVGVFPSRN
ncbi:MAG: tail fiber protein [Gammaproteobacteria bacterium]|nr:tail fiber protein [Gammaproteobacteria bacterium]